MMVDNTPSPFVKRWKTSIFLWSLAPIFGEAKSKWMQLTATQNQFPTKFVRSYCELSPNTKTRKDEGEQHHRTKTSKARQLILPLLSLLDMLRSVCHRRRCCCNVGWRRLSLVLVCCCPRCCTLEHWLSSSSYIHSSVDVAAVVCCWSYSRHCIIVVVVVFLELRMKDERNHTEIFLTTFRSCWCWLSSLLPLVQSQDAKINRQVLLACGYRHRVTMNISAAQHG